MTQEKLHFYGLYKQATEGSCKAKKPSRFNLVAKSKWYVGRRCSTLLCLLLMIIVVSIARSREACNGLSSMKKEDAMKIYCQKALELSRRMPGKETESLRRDLEG